MSKIYDYEILKDFIPLLYSTMTMKICAYIARRTDICFYNKKCKKCKRCKLELLFLFLST